MIMQWGLLNAFKPRPCAAASGLSALFHAAAVADAEDQQPLKKARRESAPRLARHRQELRSAAAAADAAAARPAPRSRTAGGQQGKSGPGHGAQPDGRHAQLAADAGTGAAQQSQATAKWTPRGDASSRSQQSNAVGRGKPAATASTTVARAQVLQGHSVARDTAPAAKGAAAAQQKFRPPSKLSGATPQAAAGRPVIPRCRHLGS